MLPLPHTGSSGIPCAGANDRTCTAQPGSPAGANTVTPVAESEVVHSLSAARSGFKAARAAASLISPTSQTGPTSIFSNGVPAASAIAQAPAAFFTSATLGCGARTKIALPSTRRSRIPAPHS
jgi:hypothetical protein